MIVGVIGSLHSHHYVMYTMGILDTHVVCTLSFMIIEGFLISNPRV